MAVWVALFAAGFGINLTLPFLPLFISKELDLSAPDQLAFWSGVVLAAGNLSALLCQPIWGLVGDRVGRRPMVIRSMAGVAITLLLTSLVPNVSALVGSRFLMGVVGGNTSSAQAIVVDGSPRYQIGWALGMASSARPIGQAIGPLVGGVLVSLIPIRLVFVLGALLIATILIPVAAFLEEPSRFRLDAKRPSFRTAFKAMEAHRVKSIAALGVALTLGSLTCGGDQQVLLLQVLHLQKSAPELTTGLMYAAFGITTGGAAIGYTKLLDAIGFKRTAIAGAAGLGAVTLTIPFASSGILLIAVGAAVGIAFGTFLATINSMIGLEAPHNLKSTIFGVASSSFILGNGLGPFIAGVVAARFGIDYVVVVLVLSALFAVIALLWFCREPRVDE